MTEWEKKLQHSIINLPEGYFQPIFSLLDKLDEPKFNTPQTRLTLLEVQYAAFALVTLMHTDQTEKNPALMRDGPLAGMSFAKIFIMYNHGFKLFGFDQWLQEMLDGKIWKAQASALSKNLPASILDEAVVTRAVKEMGWLFVTGKLLREFYPDVDAAVLDARINRTRDAYERAVAAADRLAALSSAPSAPPMSEYDGSQYASLSIVNDSANASTSASAAPAQRSPTSTLFTAISSSVGTQYVALDDVPAPAASSSAIGSNHSSSASNSSSSSSTSNQPITQRRLTAFAIKQDAPAACVFIQRVRRMEAPTDVRHPKHGEEFPFRLLIIDDEFGNGRLLKKYLAENIQSFAGRAFQVDRITADELKSKSKTERYKLKRADLIFVFPIKSKAADALNWIRDKFTPDHIKHICKDVSLTDAQYFRLTRDPNNANSPIFTEIRPGIDKAKKLIDYRVSMQGNTIDELLQDIITAVENKFLDAYTNYGVTDTQREMVQNKIFK